MALLTTATISGLTPDKFCRLRDPSLYGIAFPLVFNAVKKGDVAWASFGATYRANTLSALEVGTTCPSTIMGCVSGGLPHAKRVRVTL